MFDLSYHPLFSVVMQKEKNNSKFLLLSPAVSKKKKKTCSNQMKLTVMNVNTLALIKDSMPTRDYSAFFNIFIIFSFVK